MDLLELQLHLPGSNQSEFLNGTEERNWEANAGSNSVICLFHEAWTA